MGDQDRNGSLIYKEHYTMSDVIDQINGHDDELYHNKKTECEFFDECVSKKFYKHEKQYKLKKNYSLAFRNNNKQDVFE